MKIEVGDNVVSIFYILVVLSLIFIVLKGLYLILPFILMAYLGYVFFARDENEDFEDEDEDE